MRQIAIILGSKADLGVFTTAQRLLEEGQVPYELKILSAHRHLPQLLEFVRNFEADGGQVLIAGAGMAAHLPGIIAATTRLPVIGVPLEAGPLRGLDALLSMVQMPRGTPVATMAIGAHGAINAVLLALRILGLQYDWAEEVLKNYETALRGQSEAAL